MGHRRAVVDFHERYVGTLLKKLGFSHISVRPRHPAQDERIVEAFKKTSPAWLEGGTDKLAGVLGHLEQRRCRLEQPRDPRSMGLFRRLVREALPKIAVENGGPNLKQKMGAPL